MRFDFSSGSIQRKEGEGIGFVAQPLSFSLLFSDCFLMATMMPTRKIRTTPMTMPAMAPAGTAGLEVT